MEKKLLLCYGELHVGDKCYYVHKVIEAVNAYEALDVLIEYCKGTPLQAKGCCGELTLDLVKKYLK